MTVFSFFKYAFIFTSLLGLIGMCAGAWKVWASYNFARHAEVKQGEFRGYHLHRYKSSTRDTSGNRNYRMVEEYLPMFSYTDDSGRRHEITGTDGHFFQHLKSKVNESVKVLVSPDNLSAPRLGDALSLYCNGTLLGFISSIFFILPLYGVKLIGNRITQTATALNENQTFVVTMFDRIGQAHLPVSDIIIVFGGFFLLAGCMFGYIYYFFNKRQDMSLIGAIQDQNYEYARILAGKGRGVDAKNSESDTALMVAIKAGQSDIACSIINNLWVNTHAMASDGTSTIQLAAVNGDYRALKLLLEKGEHIYDIKPAAIYHLIRKGDTKMLQVIIDNGLDLNQTYAGPIYGDQAILEGQGDVVRLIQKHNGLFKAPPAFMALATNDTEALRVAIKDTKTSKKKFKGFTLEKFAKKIGRSDLLKNAGEI